MRRAGLFLIGAIILATTANAQEADPDIDALLNDINQGINQIVNAATLFTSQESVSSGYFKFKANEPDESDTEMDVLRLPARFDLSNDPDAQLKPFVRGQLGYLRASESLAAIEGGGDADFSVIKTFTAELGGGVDIVLVEGLVLTPEGSISYSRVENNYDYNNPFSQQIIQPLFDEEAFNWDLDIITYSPKVKLAYTLPIDPVKITISSRYAYFYNDSVGSTSSIIDISSDTNLFQNGIQATIPLGFSVFESGVGFRPFFVRSDVHGAARRGLEFAHFYEVGGDFLFGTKESIGLLSELSVGSSYTFGHDFEGWRIGVGYKF